MTVARAAAPLQHRADLIELLARQRLGQTRSYSKGSVLYWPGDPVDGVYAILQGAIKVSSISEDGRVFTHGILGRGRLLGASTYLMGSDHDHVAETLEKSRLLVMPPADFENALARDPLLSAIVMKEMASATRLLSDQMRELSFLDVQERLKHSLVRLAEEHGLITEQGIKIDLKITHEDMGALVAANRCTITVCLSELKQLGYLWTEGRRLVIIPPEQMRILDALCQTIIDGDEDTSVQQAHQAVAEHIDPLKALEALTSGMKRIDVSYSRGEIDLPDVVMSAFAMKRSLPIIETQIRREQKEFGAVGTVVIGTVRGDIHDIGKTIVAMLLKARGFQVVDLGVDVTPARFVDAVRAHTPDILAMSALTTATSVQIARVMQALKEAGLRDQVKVMVGGGAVTPALARQVGAEEYHASARGAVELAWRLCTWS